MKHSTRQFIIKNLKWSFVPILFVIGMFLYNGKYHGFIGYPDENFIQALPFVFVLSLLINYSKQFNIAMNVLLALIVALLWDFYALAAAYLISTVLLVLAFSFLSW